MISKAFEVIVFRNLTFVRNMNGIRFSRIKYNEKSFFFKPLKIFFVKKIDFVNK